MGDVDVEILVTALALAATPFTVVLALLLVLSSRPVAAGSAFLAGWAGSILVATAAAVALTDVLGGDEGKPRWVGVVQALLGLALVVYGLAQVVPARRGDPPPEFLAALDDMAPTAAARLGLVLVAANPKALLLCASAGVGIAAGAAGLAGEVVGVAVFTAVASVSAWTPLLLHATLGERATAPMRRLKDAVLARYYVVMAVVLVAIGVLLLLGARSLL